MTKIDNFRDNHAFLSNGYPCAVTYKSQIFASVEAAYQAAKTDDQDLRNQIRGATNARDICKIGRNLELRQSWDDEERLEIMYYLIESKFIDNLDLKKKLLETGNSELIQGNSKNSPSGKFWGQTSEGVGENNLGKILMEIRAIL